MTFTVIPNGKCVIMLLDSLAMMFLEGSAGEIARVVTTGFDFGTLLRPWLLFL